MNRITRPDESVRILRQLKHSARDQGGGGVDQQRFDFKSFERRLPVGQRAVEEMLGEDVKLVIFRRSSNGVNRILALHDEDEGGYYVCVEVKMSEGEEDGRV